MAKLTVKVPIKFSDEAQKDLYETCMAYKELAETRGAENAKLRTQLADVTESMGRVEERCAKMRELVERLFGRLLELLDENDELQEQLEVAEHNRTRNVREYARMCHENDDLRELVRHMWSHDYARHFSTLDSDMEHRESVWQRMHELGIEVGE